MKNSAHTSDDRYCFLAPSQWVMTFHTFVKTQAHSRRKQSRWHQCPATTCTSFLLTFETSRCAVS